MLCYATTNGGNHGSIPQLCHIQTYHYAASSTKYGGICGGTMTSLYNRNGSIDQLCSNSQQDI